MPFTIEQQSSGSTNVYSDTVNGSSVLVKLVGPVSSISSLAGLEVSLTSDAQGTVPIPFNRATISPALCSTKGNGDVVEPLEVVILDGTLPTNSIYLVITDPSSGDFNALILPTTVFSGSALEVKPELITEPVPRIAATATLTPVTGGAIPAGIPMTWAIDSTKYLRDLTPPVNQPAATVAAQTVYELDTKPIGAYTLASNGDDVITFSLMLGDPIYGMKVGGNSPISTIELGLLAPYFGLDQNLITNQTQQACKKDGYPVIIPVTHSMQKDDYIYLYAYDSVNDPNVNSPYMLNQHQIKTKEIGQLLQIMVPVETPPLIINGAYDIFYVYKKTTDGNQATSPTFLLNVALTGQDPYLSNPDKSLTPPYAQPQPYNRKNFDNNEDLLIKVTFDGKTKPKKGDQVQPLLHLIGCTSGNLNRVYDRGVPTPYTIQDRDIPPNGVVELVWPDAASGRRTITHDQLASIDGSNGVMVYTYTTTLGQVSMSPGQPMSVDTVNPYSNPTPPDLAEVRTQLMQYKGKK
ncbi:MULTISPECIES: hypothetical protein [unclassified Achromobacter]|uniref:hypothetical protein n=1 Tax=unclassified Achromobacter TaxID=2626865 RepID=UPI000B51D313|nr:MULTISPECIES: hypothetical protein [unclassified Achromobacter]OWT75289.1 hypothetical protein CEY04_16910 [Achromobacter sp. HZ28]OWT75948.1 hypothetical protein CEY05_12360 [Achromobacter sp. HZ34]